MNIMNLVAFVVLFATVLKGEPVFKILHGSGRWIDNSPGHIEKRSIAPGGSCNNPNTTLSQLEQAECVDKHNSLREAAGFVPAADEAQMLWDDGLANLAQKLADECVFNHGYFVMCDGSDVGQNLGVTTAKDPSPSVFVQSWYNELNHYDYHTGVCTITEENRSCGHYTQLVWHTTSYVGCAKKHCDSVVIDAANNISWEDATLFVCNYSPPGNYVGQKPYASGAPCSACGNIFKNNTYKCENQLCVGCDPLVDSDCRCIQDGCVNGQNFDSTTCTCANCAPGSCGIVCGQRDAIQSPYCGIWKTYGYCNKDSAYAPYMNRNCYCSCIKKD